MDKHQGKGMGDGNGKIVNKHANFNYFFLFTWRELLTIVLIAVSGFAICFDFSWYLKNQTKKVLIEKFNIGASERVNLIEDGLSDNLRELDAICRFFKTTSSITKT